MCVLYRMICELKTIGMPDHAEHSTPLAEMEIKWFWRYLEGTGGHRDDLKLKFYPKLDT